MKPLFALACTLLTLSACNGSLYRPDVTVIDPKTGKSTLKTDLTKIEAGILKTFPDVPIPATHKINLDESMIFNSTNQTIGKLTSEGSGDPASVFQFYQENMTAGGWNLVNGFQSSTSSLYFAKPGKFAAIIIEPSGRNGSKVTINVGPE